MNIVTTDGAYVPAIKNIVPHLRWAFPIIDAAYHGPDNNSNSYLFICDDTLYQNTALNTPVKEERAIFSIPAADGTTGCMLYARYSTDFPGDPIFFAYREKNNDFIIAKPPRIEIDENEVRYLSGNTGHLMARWKLS